MPEKIIRIMTFSQYDAHSKPQFMKLHILDLQKLIIHRIALMMYKHSVQLLPVPVSNLFTKNSSIHRYNTRSCNMLHTNIGSSEVTYTNFSDHGRGVCRISQGEGPNFNIFGILDIHAAKLRAFVRGVWGHAPPPKKFFENGAIS